MNITESGERIRTPIIWDMKTGENITPKDIEKAKRYKEKYDTDYSIVVTAKGITTKDSKTYRTGIIGKRENVLLAHPNIAIAVAELTRNMATKNLAKGDHYEVLQHRWISMFCLANTFYYKHFK